MRLKFSFAEQEELDAIHEATLEVLKNVGVNFHEEESLEIFRRNGARVDGTTVFIEQKLLEKALSTAPSHFDWVGRENKVTIGDGGSISVPCYGPIYRKKGDRICDIVPQDYVDVTKLHETSSIFDAGNPNVMEPIAIPRTIRRNYQMATALKYHTKPIMGMVDGKEAAEMSIKMTQDFYDVHDQTAVVSGLINVMSPLGISTAMCEALIVYARAGQPVVVAEGGFPGVTLPPSIAGTIVSNNAGILAGIVLAQLVNPGTPVIYGLPAVSGDLRAISMAIGGAETPLFIYYAKEIANYYHLPVRAGGGLTDAKAVDYQAGKETALNLFATYGAGIDFVIHACGILDTYNTISFEKLVLDEETVLSVKRQFEGFVVDEKHMMVKDIQKAGPGGSYINKRTPKIYREEFMLPRLANRETTQNWIKGGCTSVEQLASELVEERIANYKLPELNDFQKKILDKNIPEEFCAD
ncbi:MAG: trimethylamine methyltransferase family protein [Eubacterium sp.]